MVQIARPGLCYIVDARKVKDLSPLRIILEDKNILKLLQNAKFDYKFLHQKVGLEIIHLYDTFLAEKLLTAGLMVEANLAALSLKYLGVALDKSVRESFYNSSTNTRDFETAQLVYGAKDVFSLFGIYTKQLRDLRANDLMPVAELEFRCVEAVAHMELAGCLIDVAKWREVLAGIGPKRDKAQEELMAILPGGQFGYESLWGGEKYAVNINSGQQIISEFKKLGVDLPDTQEKTLKKINHDAARKLLEYRGLEKSLVAFGESLLSLINPATGRLHADYVQIGAQTGRFSCKSPNLQQIPAASDFRSCFIPATGYKFVNCDFGSCELRILAELSGDEIFINTFNSGGDLHKVAASMVFGIPIEEVTKEQRGVAKTIGFGLIYGLGVASLSATIQKTLEESKQLVDSYFSQFPRIKTYLDTSGKFAVKNLYSETLMGRKRFYRKPIDNEERGSVERQGKNAPIQGINADSLKATLISLREKLKPFDARLIGCYHDEVLVEVIEEQAEIVCGIVEAEMIKSLEIFVKKVKVVADAKITDYWSK
jgi:DNA polymerase-1